MRRALPVLVAAAVAVSAAGCNPLNDEELRRQVLSFQSIAAEGALVAGGVADDRTKATFVRVHAGELASEAEDGAQKLNDAAVPDDLRDNVQRAIEIAMRASDALGELTVSPGDEAVGARVEGELKQIASDAEREASSIAEEHE
jgi:hypothetical protein